MVLPRECKRLAEVDFPIAVVSKHAAREKSIRNGHPSTLQLWWARRPLASSRAMLLALLMPDPCDEHCPPEFKVRARELLPKVQGSPGAEDEDLRSGLLKFIGDFANWDLAAHPLFLEVGRGLVRAANPEGPPLIVDPFAGGGSIPLEALRLGCEAFASDLNPVACLILRLTLEDIPRHGPGLMEELRALAMRIRLNSERKLASFFPLDNDGARPIAYFWARTIRCESPTCGAEIPLVSSLWLSKRTSHKRALQPSVIQRPNGPPSVDFSVFEPLADEDVLPGTARGGKAKCLACGEGVSPKRLQTLMTQQRNGVDVKFGEDFNRISGARLVAVAYTPTGGTKREYRLPFDSDYAAMLRAQTAVEALQAADSPFGSVFPDEPVNPTRPSPNARGLSAVTRYGVRSFSDLFNARQKLSLHFLQEELAAELRSGDADRRRLAELLSPALGKRADYSSGGTRWHLTFEKATCTFSKQALSQTWDYIEPTALGTTSGSYGAGLETVIAAVAAMASAQLAPGQSQVADATDSPLPSDSAAVWFTDPPYYDAIPYADLSDFFFVWLKRVFPEDDSLLKLLDEHTGLTPKTQECVWNQSYLSEGRPKDGRFFESCAALAFAEGARVLAKDGIGSVVFAHKTTEGWEALLNGLVAGGWVITASWPLATERAGRLQSQNSAALATSVHLVCRPRAEDAPLGDWADVLREVPGRVAVWMERLQIEGVRGADLVFACIGPALEIYSRYSKVVDAEDRQIPLGGDPEATDPHQRGYLAYVWETVGRAALQQVLGRDEETGALEEDARLVSLFLWTLQSTNGTNNGAHDEQESELDDSTSEEDDDDDDDDDDELSGRKPKGYTLIFDVARRFAQPLGIHLDDWDGRVIETKKGVVRLLPVAERAKQLFGDDGAQAAADRIEKEPASAQLSFFPEVQVESKPRRGRRKVTIAASDESISQNRSATTLDRLHVAMLLQASGRANALRSLLGAEHERGPEFLRLANALSALYPRESEEKRLLDAMLLAVPR